MILALGDAYLEKGLYAEAAKRYHQLLEFRVANKRVYSNFSKALIGLKRFDQYAMSIYQKAIEHDPNNTEIYTILASTYLKERKEDTKAIQIYEMAMQHETPIFQSLAEFLATLYYRKSEYEKCYRVAQRLLNHSEDYENVLPMYMESCWKTGQYHDAITQLKKLVDITENNAMLLKHLCTTYLEKKFDGEVNNHEVRFSYIDRQLILDYLDRSTQFQSLQELSFYLELKRFLLEREYWGTLADAPEQEQEESMVVQTAEGTAEVEHRSRTPKSNAFNINHDVLHRLSSFENLTGKNPQTHSSLTFEDFQKQGAEIFNKTEGPYPQLESSDNAEIIMTIEFTNFSYLYHNYGAEHAQQIKHKLLVMVTDLLEKHHSMQIWGIANGLLIFTDDIFRAVALASDLLNKLNRHNFISNEQEEIHLSIGVHHARTAFGNNEQSLRDLSTGIKVSIATHDDLSDEDRPIYGKVFQKKDRIFLSSRAYREVKSSSRFKVNSIGQFRLKYLKDDLSLHEVAWRDPIDDLKFGYIKKLGRFDLLAEIGSKGPIKVFKGKDSGLQRFVIVKVVQSETFNALPAGNPLKQEFYQLSKSLGQMSHPNIVNIYEVDEDQGLTYIAREFIEGTSITEVFRSGNPFNPDQIIQMIYQICKGLQYSHRFGFFHLNLKPSNIRFGLNHDIKIMDFRVPGKYFEDYRDFVDENDLAYRAPEQLHGRDGDARSDIFSLGVILYEMVTNRHPFALKHAGDIRDAILNSNPPVPSEINSRVPKFCDALILKCMRKDPDKRIQTIEQIVTLLKKNFESTLFSSFNYHIAQSRDSY